MQSLLLQVAKNLFIVVAQVNTKTTNNGVVLLNFEVFGTSNIEAVSSNDRFHLANQGKGNGAY